MNKITPEPYKGRDWSSTDDMWPERGISGIANTLSDIKVKEYRQMIRQLRRNAVVKYGSKAMKWFAE